jgi:hypothetical protein
MLHLQNERKSGTVVAPADAAFASAFCRLPSPVAQPGGISLFTAKSLCQQSPSRSRLFHTPPHARALRGAGGGRTATDELVVEDWALLRRSTQLRGEEAAPPQTV